MSFMKRKLIFTFCPEPGLPEHFLSEQESEPEPRYLPIVAKTGANIVQNCPFLALSDVNNLAPRWLTNVLLRFLEDDCLFLFVNANHPLGRICLAGVCFPQGASNVGIRRIVHFNCSKQGYMIKAVSHSRIIDLRRK